MYSSLLYKFHNWTNFVWKRSSDSVERRTMIGSVIFPVDACVVSWIERVRTGASPSSEMHKWKSGNGVAVSALIRISTAVSREKSLGFNWNLRGS